MKKNTLIEYGLLVLAITFFIMSTCVLFLYFSEGINSQMNSQQLHWK